MRGGWRKRAGRQERGANPLRVHLSRTRPARRLAVCTGGFAQDSARHAARACSRGWAYGPLDIFWPFRLNQVLRFLNSRCKNTKGLVRLLDRACAYSAFRKRCRNPAKHCSFIPLPTHRCTLRTPSPLFLPDTVRLRHSSSHRACVPFAV